MTFTPDGKITREPQDRAGTKGEGNNIKTMNFAPAATVIFGDTPLCVLKNDCHDRTMAGAGDFKKFYEMGKNGDSTKCNAAPSNCQACRSGGPCPTACPVNPQTKKISVTMDIDCSNSQWP